jgi:hypothetical protein
MSRRRKNALKRRRRAAPRKLALVPPRPVAEVLPLADDLWPILPPATPRGTHGPSTRHAVPVRWAPLLRHRGVVYVSVAMVVGLVVLWILRWLEAADQSRTFVGPPLG